MIIIYIIGAFLAGACFDRVWQKFMEEDLVLMKSEAIHICNRLDRVLTEFNQREAGKALNV